MLRVIQPHDTFTVIMQNKKSLILGGILIVLAIIFFQTVSSTPKFRHLVSV